LHTGIVHELDFLFGRPPGSSHRDGYMFSYSTYVIYLLVYALNFQMSSHTDAHNFEAAQHIDKWI